MVILGPSGSGKTTLLRTINFLGPADAGTITVDGLTVDSQKHHHKETLALRRKTGMVFQNYNLFRNKTVLQNITEGLTTVRKIPHEQAVERPGPSEKNEPLKQSLPLIRRSFPAASSSVWASAERWP